MDIFVMKKREERILQNDTFFFPFGVFCQKKKTPSRSTQRKR